MLNLTRKTEYALMALAYLAKRDDAAGLDQTISAREIAQRFDVPAPMMMNVLKSLGKAELVTSSRGANGGYALAAAPAEVDLLQVVQAIEGPLRLARCIEADQDESPGCDIECLCPIRDPIQKMHQRLGSFLREISLAELIADPPEETLVSVGLNTDQHAVATPRE